MTSFLAFFHWLQLIRLSVTPVMIKNTMHALDERIEEMDIKYKKIVGNLSANLAATTLKVESRYSRRIGVYDDARLNARGAAVRMLSNETETETPILDLTLKTEDSGIVSEETSYQELALNLISEDSGIVSEPEAEILENELDKEFKNANIKIEHEKFGRNDELENKHDKDCRNEDLENKQEEDCK
ncbi:L-2-aminoadipate reductase [Tanacetum coccineum]